MVAVILASGIFFAKMATAPQKMKVKTLEGEMLAVEVAPTLRAMLLESKRWRFDWTPTPQSGGPDRGIVDRWWPDGGICRTLVCWIGRDGRLRKTRSWSGNERRHSWRRPSGSHRSVPCHENQKPSLRRLPTSFAGDSPRVRDIHWWECLCRLSIFGTYHLARITDSHWTMRLSTVHIFGKRHYTWISNINRGQCFCRMHILETHHTPEVID